MHTCFLKHLIALVKNQNLEVSEIKFLLFDQSKDSTWSSYNNVRGLNSFKNLDVITNGLSTVHDLSSELRQVFGKSSKFVLDLIGKLTNMAENKGRARFGLFRQLMENSENKHCRLTHS